MRRCIMLSMMLISMLCFVSCAQEATSDPEKDKEFADYIFSQIEETEKKEEQKNLLKEMQKTTQGTMKIFAQAIEEKNYDKFASVIIPEYCKEILPENEELHIYTKGLFDEITSLKFQIKGLNRSYIISSQEELNGIVMVEYFMNGIQELYQISDEKIEAIAIQEYDVKYSEEDNQEKDKQLPVILFKFNEVWYINLHIY